MTGRNESLKKTLILLGLSYVFFVLGNGVLSLTNPDEVFYVQTAKEMVQHDSWMTPYLFGVPQFEKPILLYWLLRVGLLASGVSPFSASSAFASRFFPALFAAVGVIAVYFLARIGLKNERKAFLSAIVLLSSGLYMGLARTVYTDMIFSVFILLALTFFFWGYETAQRRGVGFVLFFVFCALAVLTKGPLGFGIPFLIVVVFLAIRGELRIFVCRSSAWGFLLFLAVALPWYVFVIQRFGGAFTHEFFYNDHIRRLFEAEHPGNDTWYFYLGTAVVGMFPWSIFVAVSFVQLVGRVIWRVIWHMILKQVQPIYMFLLCWILVTFAIFQPAHSKLVSYIVPMFPALAIMTGDLVYDWIETKERRLAYALALISLVTVALIPLGLIIGPRFYHAYLPPRALVNVLIALFVVLLITMLLLIAKKKFLQCVYLLSPVLPILFFFGLSWHDDIDPRLSGKSACQYLIEHNSVENRILCSKYFARGVYYYTNKDVAVINVGGNCFFSPHPIPYLDTDEEVKGFLKSQSTTYCILDKSSFNHLQRIAGDEMRLDIQKMTGDEYVVRVETD